MAPQLGHGGDARVDGGVKETVIAVDGASCRQQIELFTDRKTRHIAQGLALRIDPEHVYQVRGVQGVEVNVALVAFADANTEQVNEGQGKACVCCLRRH